MMRWILLSLMNFLRLWRLIGEYTGYEFSLAPVFACIYLQFPLPLLFGLRLLSVGRFPRKPVLVYQQGIHI